MNTITAKPKIENLAESQRKRLIKSLKNLCLKGIVSAPALALLSAASPAEAKEPLQTILKEFQKAPENQIASPSVIQSLMLLSEKEDWKPQKTQEPTPEL